MGALLSFATSTAPPYVDATSDEKGRELQKILSRLALEVPLAKQHRNTILQAMKYVDADGDMRDAIILFDEHFYAMDVSVSVDLYVHISTFYATYADLITNAHDAAYVHPALDAMLETRKLIFGKLAELELKVFRISADPAYAIVLDLVRGATTSCLAALWHKYGHRDAISMYYPAPAPAPVSTAAATLRLNSA
jgi:hypothetical protein